MIIGRVYRRVPTKKEQIIELCEEGVPVDRIAETVDTGKDYVYRIRAKEGLKPDETPDATPDEEPARSLDLDDEGDPPDYECGECGEPVAYLTRECPECGERLMWAWTERADE